MGYVVQPCYLARCSSATMPCSSATLPCSSLQPCYLAVQLAIAVLPCRAAWFSSLQPCYFAVQLGSARYSSATLPCSSLQPCYLAVQLGVREGYDMRQLVRPLHTQVAL